MTSASPVQSAEREAARAERAALIAYGLEIWMEYRRLRRDGFIRASRVRYADFKRLLIVAHAGDARRVYRDHEAAHQEWRQREGIA